MKHYGLVFALSMTAAVAAAAVACGDASPGASPESALDPTGVPPTFVRIAVTPAPIGTLVPTLAPSAGPSFNDEELANPEFPDWLDPELTDEQPGDETVFAGWQEYLTNTSIEFDDGRRVNFCAGGVIVGHDGEINQDARWQVKRTAAMSSRQWGKVALIARVISGPNEGREFTFMVISREDGKVLQSDLARPIEITVTRSWVCLELAPPALASGREFTDAELADPVFPDSLDPELVANQPADEVVFAGWSEFLMNTSVSSEGAQTTWHLCSDGLVMSGDRVDGTRQNWRVKRSSAIADSDWGSVAVIVTGIAGRFEGREFTLLQLTRKVGKIFVLNTVSPGPVEIKRSQQCLKQ